MGIIALKSRVLTVLGSPLTYFTHGHWRRTQGIQHGSPAAKMRKIHTQSTETDITPLKTFALLLLPPIINDSLGLRAIQLLTIPVIFWDPITSRQTKLLSRWPYLLPALLASTAGSDTLWLAIFAFQLWMLLNCPQILITTPAVLACIAVPLTLCPALKDTHFEHLGLGVFCSSVCISLIQISVTRDCFDATSSKYIRWYSLRRAEYLTLLAAFVTWSLYLDHNAKKSALWFWIGVSFVGCLITAVQRSARCESG